jgi:uncharacterized membrane protein YgcG
MKNLDFGRIIRSLPMIGMTLLLSTSWLLVAPKIGFAQDTGTPMAPPVGADAGADAPAPAVATVFNWQEVPVNQDVPIQSAVFDQGGYQLYDTVGETIVVKFKNDNLYAMKFAVSEDGTTYFVNTGTSPVLYLPVDSYLENATVPGARWYPFDSNFQPSTPVYLGVAPSWSDFVSIGWYPNMYCYGGYWCGSSFGTFGPSIGLYISFGGQRFNGWGDYGNYLGNSPAPYRLGFYRQNVYQYAKRSNWGSRTFQGTTSQSLYGRVSAAGHQSDGFTGQTSQGRTFRGTSGSVNSRSNPQPSQGFGAAHSGGFQGSSHTNTRTNGSSGFGGRSSGGSMHGGGGSRGGGSSSHGGGGSSNRH